MTSILFLTEAIYCNIFRGKTKQQKISQKQKFLGNKKFFLNFFFFFLEFGNLNSIFNISKRKVTIIADVFLNLWTPKKVAR